MKEVAFGTVSWLQVEYKYKSDVPVCRSIHNVRIIRIGTKQAMDFSKLWRFSDKSERLGHLFLFIIIIIIVFEWGTLNQMHFKGLKLSCSH